MNVIKTPTPSLHGLRLQDADTFYECLLDAHCGLSREESEALNARLILLLANQVADPALLKACIEAARQTSGSSQTG